jgi:hypothetical protein
MKLLISVILAFCFIENSYSFTCRQGIILKKQKKCLISSIQRSICSNYPRTKTRAFNNDDITSSKPVIDFDIRRFVLYNLLAIVLGLGGNFLGVTSIIMTNTNPTYFQSLKLDVFYPIDNFLRIVGDNGKYEFTIPKNWLIDQTVLFAKVREAETPQTLRKAKSNTPDAAYGPMGGSGNENVSIVKSKVMPGFIMKEVLGKKNFFNHVVDIHNIAVYLCLRNSTRGC